MYTRVMSCRVDTTVVSIWCYLVVVNGDGRRYAAGRCTFSHSETASRAEATTSSAAAAGSSGHAASRPQVCGHKEGPY